MCSLQRTYSGTLSLQIDAQWHHLSSTSLPLLIYLTPEDDNKISLSSSLFLLQNDILSPSFFIDLTENSRAV